VFIVGERFSFCADGRGEQHLCFVKIIREENENFDLALRKRMFCDAKEPLLPCKTYAFAM